MPGIAWIDAGCGDLPQDDAHIMCRQDQVERRNFTKVHRIGFVCISKALGFDGLQRPDLPAGPENMGEGDIGEAGRPWKQGRGCHYRSSCRERLAGRSQNWETRFLTDPSLTLWFRMPCGKAGSWVPFRVEYQVAPRRVGLNIPDLTTQKQKSQPPPPWFKKMNHSGAAFCSLERFVAGAD